jgi:hypothetical protein
MAIVTELCVPKRFRKAFVRADQPNREKVIEFCSRARVPASITPSGGVIAWLLSGTCPTLLQVVSGL